MDERYTRLFALPENLYTKGSPVLIAAGTLLKDTQTGKVLAQLKLQNISPKKIRVVKVDISAFDTEGNAVAGVSEFSYLDLAADRDAFFGSQTPIALPDKVTRSYAAQVTGVVFTDGTTWEAPADAAYAPLKAPVRLTQTLGIALTDQYRRQTFPKANYMVEDVDDLWYCACGAINHTEETACHTCGRAKDELIAALDINTLKKNHDEYIAEQKAAAEKKAAAQKALIKKCVKWGSIAAGALAVILAIVWVITGVILPANNYKKAVALMEDGQYNEAIAIFAELDDYKDSEERIADAATWMYYYNAVALMEGRPEDVHEIIIPTDDDEEEVELLEVIEDAQEDAVAEEWPEDAVVQEWPEEAVEEESYEIAYEDSPYTPESIDLARESIFYDYTFDFYYDEFFYAELTDATQEQAETLAAEWERAQQIERARCMFDDLGDFHDAKDRKTECHYRLAIFLAEETEIWDADQYAYNLFTDLEDMGYMDSGAYVARFHKKLDNISCDDYVEFVELDAQDRIVTKTMYLYDKAYDMCITQYTYHANGQVKQTTVSYYEDDETTPYYSYEQVFDEYGNQTEYRIGTIEHLTSYTYDSAGKVTAEEGSSTNAGELSSSWETVYVDNIKTTTYTYEKESTSNRVLKKTEQLDAHGNATLIEDQMEDATIVVTTYTYSYDAAGRILSKTNVGTGASETYTYNAKGDLLTKQDGTDTIVNTYDEDGRQITSEVNGVTLTYNYRMVYEAK